MRRLATTFRKDSYDFSLVERIGDVALFEKRYGDHLSWEVVVIQKHAERTMGGKAIPATEAMPPAESWGQKGWTLTTLEKARARFDEVVQREAARRSA